MPQRRATGLGSFIRSIVRGMKRVTLVRRLARRSVLLLPDIPFTVRVQGIGPVRMRLRRHVGIWGRSLLERPTPDLGMLERLIQVGDVVYDVGAHIGLYSRVMVQWFKAGQVIAFEPMKDNVELLHANVLLLNQNDKIRIFAVALSDCDGTEQLQVDDVTGGTAVLNRVSGGKASKARQRRGLPPKTETVEVVQLDRLVERESLRPPNVMKIDTEGAAGLVVRGARCTLQRAKPRMVIALHNPQESSAVLELVSPLGYACYGPVLDHGQEVYRRLEPRDAPYIPKCDIVCSCRPEEVSQPIAPLRQIPQRAPSSLRRRR